MQHFKSLSQWRAYRASLKGTVGFIPTMGALHEGHLSLVQQSTLDNDHTVVSIYINPTQFNNPSDLEAYPNTLEEDLSLLKPLNVQAVLTPNYNDLYPDNYKFRVTENTLSNMLCGAHRPGHFDGVLTVVLKLLMLVKPHRAYFGEKDFQQLKLITDMVESFFLDCQIVPMPIIRAQDGLALSSRNQRLSAEQRALAPALFQILKSSPHIEGAYKSLTELGFKVDYIEEHFNHRLAAASLGDVRLIDNVEI